MSKKITDHKFHWRDVRVLREAVAKAANKLPPEWSQYMNSQLLLFAQNIRPDCPCPERAYVDLEKKDACLFCGKRHEPSKRSHLKSIK